MRRLTCLTFSFLLFFSAARCSALCAVMGGVAFDASELGSLVLVATMMALIKMMMMMMMFQLMTMMLMIQSMTMAWIFPTSPDLAVDGGRSVEDIDVSN